jgi:stage III sporulation protein AG
MELDFRKIIRFLSSDKHKATVVMAVGAILIILFSGIFSSAKQETGTRTAPEQTLGEYCADLEKKLEKLLLNTEGVGSVDVMITLENSHEYLYAQEESKSSSRSIGDQGSDESIDENNSEKLTVLNDGSGGETPVLLTKMEPKIKGIVIVCAGADDPVIRLRVMDTVKTLFNVASNRIYVAKKTK